MMKNKDIYAVAVRKPDNEIAVELNTHKDFSDKVKLFKLPIFRGMVAFVDSMVIGVKVLNYSASFFDEEEEATQNKNKKKDKKSSAKEETSSNEDEDFIVEEVAAPHSDQEELASTKAESAKKEDKSSALLMALAVLISIVMSVALFMVLPVIITNFFSRFISNRYLVLFIEGIVRLAIFIGYVLLASRMKEIKRVFMYHGAEHKTINCLENGFELTVENVRWQSKQHKRCGTSFMLLVILISLIFFMFMPITSLFWKVISRILLVPFIAGVSYEFIRLAGKNESRLVNILSQPGLWMQGLTTREPDDSMIEVAIASVSAVFDWKAFLETSVTKDTKGKNVKQSSNKQTEPTAKASKQPTEKQNGTNQTTAGKNVDKNVVDKKQQKLENKPAAKSVASRTTETKSHLEVKPQTGGLAYTGKVETNKSVIGKQDEKKAHVEAAAVKHETEKHAEGPSSAIGRNKGTAPVIIKPNAPMKEEEEDDDILKALDKFFDDTKKER